MKLRNKKTGEIRDFGWAEIISCNTNLGYDVHYGSLAKLNEDWEDYEEPKGYWYIRDGGNIDHNLYGKSIINRHKEIGNYFETKEEAEKAVEKLKAWKRLRDNGLKITGCGKYAYDTKSTHYINIALDYATSDEDREALDLLFGGENE